MLPSLKISLSNQLKLNVYDIWLDIYGNNKSYENQTKRIMLYKLHFSLPQINLEDFIIFKSYFDHFEPDVKDASELLELYLNDDWLMFDFKYEPDLKLLKIFSGDKLEMQKFNLDFKEKYLKLHLDSIKKKIAKL